MRDRAIETIFEIPFHILLRYWYLYGTDTNFAGTVNSWVKVTSHWPQPFFYFFLLIWRSKGAFCPTLGLVLGSLATALWVLARIPPFLSLLVTVVSSWGHEHLGRNVTAVFCLWDVGSKGLGYHPDLKSSLSDPTLPFSTSWSCCFKRSFVVQVGQQMKCRHRVKHCGK